MPRAAKSAPPPPAPAQPPGPGWIRKTLFQPRVLIALAIVGAAVQLAPYVRQWLPILEQLPEYRFETSQIQVSAPNRWVPRGFVQQLVDDGRLPSHLLLLENGLADRIAAALAGDPWVKEVEAVRVTRGGVTAELKYRVPVLMIETRTGIYPVDRDSVLLPPKDFAASDLQRFPKLANVPTTPAGPAGTEWGDPIVLGAARLAEFLAPDGDLSIYWERFQLASIEASERTAATMTLEDVVYELVTRGRSRIIWGRAPGADDLEPTVAQKLGRLDNYLSNHGGFESQGRPNRIDIRNFDTTEVSRLETPGGRR